MFRRPLLLVIEIVLVLLNRLFQATFGALWVKWAKACGSWTPWYTVAVGVALVFGLPVVFLAREYSLTSATLIVALLIPAVTPLLLVVLLDNRQSVSKKHLARIARGECRKCGYDLRATPDRCPECGEVAPVPPPALVAPAAAEVASASTGGTDVGISFSFPP